MSIDTVYPGVLDTVTSLGELINNLSTTTSGSYTTPASTLDLTDGSSFPSTGGVIYVDNERGVYTGRTVNQLTGVTGLGNNHNAGVTVEQNYDADYPNAVIDAVIALQTKLGVTGDTTAGRIINELAKLATRKITKSAADTLTAADAGMIEMDTNAAVVPLTLPAANASNLSTFIFFHTDGSNAATVLRAGADTIEPGAATTVTVPVNGFLALRSDGGTEWRTVAKSVESATATAEGMVELATIAEVDTGTDAARAVSPDGLAGSYAATKVIQIVVIEWVTATATGDGKAYVHIPAALNGMNLITVHAEVISAGTTGTTDIQIRNATQAADMLSTVITIDSGETGSDTAATPAVIDTAEDDVATNDIIRIDVDAISTTPADGLIVTMEFRLP